MMPMKLMCLLPRSTIQSNSDSNNQHRSHRRRRIRILCRQDHDALQQELFQASPRRMMIMPSPSYESTDFSCATTTSITTAPTGTTDATFSPPTTIGGDDCFSGSKKANYHSSTSICTQAESSVSSSSSEAKESNGEDDDNPFLRYALVPSPCLKIKTAKESLSRLYSSGFGIGTSSSSGKRALAMLTALSMPSLSLSPPFSPPKHVQFSTVTVHFHALILGDNPSVSEGPPLMLDWKAFESIAYESVDDFQENKEPQHEDPSRQRQPHERKGQPTCYIVPTEMHSVRITTAATVTVTPRVPVPPKNQKRRWPAHQRRCYLKNKLGVTGTDILRVEFEVRRIQLSRKTEARIFAMEQLLSARRQEEDDDNDFNNDASNHRGVPFVHDESFASLRRYYNGSVERRQQQQEEEADVYTYTYDSSLLDEDDDDDGILAESNKNDQRRTFHEYGSTTTVVVPEEVCFSSFVVPRQRTYTTMPAGCWHPANEGKGWFITSGAKEMHTTSPNNNEV